MLTQTMFEDTVDYAVSGSLFPESQLHGQDHWQGVTAQALWLAHSTGLGTKGITTALLFGVLHDCRRENDGYDPDHGERAAEALMECPILTHLPAPFVATLSDSLILHDKGETTSNPLKGLGWDSDRSLLGRVGIDVSESFFSVATGSLFFDMLDRSHTLIQSPPSWETLWKESGL